MTSRQARFIARRKAAGLCVRCRAAEAKPAFKAGRCQEHYEAHLRENYQRQARPRVRTPNARRPPPGRVPTFDDFERLENSR